MEREDRNLREGQEIKVRRERKVTAWAIHGGMYVAVKKTQKKQIKRIRKGGDRERTRGQKPEKVCEMEGVSDFQKFQSKVIIRLKSRFTITS